jgi:hypothetical protein
VASDQTVNDILDRIQKLDQKVREKEEEVRQESAVRAERRTG